MKTEPALGAVFPEDKRMGWVVQNGEALPTQGVRGGSGVEWIECGGVVSKHTGQWGQRAHEGGAQKRICILHNPS